MPAIPGNGWRPGSDNPAASPHSSEAKRMPRSPRAAIEPDRVDLPARRSATARHPLVVIGNAVISFFVLAGLAAGIALFFGKQRFEAPGPLAADRIVNIPRGSGMRDIADILSREGVIDQPSLFIGGVLVLKAREDLKAGEYEFKAHSSMRDVVATIVEGKVVAHQVGIPEGLTSEQIVARLLQDDVLAGDIKEIPREGSLLPDTYNFARGITREQMVARMQQAEQRLLRDIWEHRAPDLPLKTPEQLVVLASLVEKETGKPEERTRVAAVFVNRLKQRMKLQSDPTIIYGLVGGKGSLGRPIMKNEIEQPTPYNTYIIDGLPPGPITNPGRASLEAAANPARTRELYFVADGTGGHAFAETYEQHQKNVARLRSIESDQKDQVPLGDQPLAAPQSAPAAAAAPAASPPRGNPPKPRATKPH
jgi:peptidoglycan lytic transglycosylase G